MNLRGVERMPGDSAGRGGPQLLSLHDGPYTALIDSPGWPRDSILQLQFPLIKVIDFIIFWNHR